jgi:hypothetical protein
MRNRLVWATAGLVLGVVAALSLPTAGQETPTPAPDRRERTVTVTGTRS